ncbi:MAG: GldM family protein [Saprospiraceae bacterium]
MNLLFLISVLFSNFTGNVPQFSKLTPSSFFIGTEGFVYIKMNGCNPEDINIKISAGYINRRNDSTFTFFPQTEGEELKLKLYYKKVICEVKTVTSKKLPEIVPRFEAERQGIIKKNELDKIGKLYQTYPADFPEDMKTEVYSFHLVILNESGMTIYGNTMRGNILDDSAMTMIKKLNKGSKLIVSNILVQNSYRGVSRSSAQLEIIVSD